jgi:hypothetical protein
MLVSKMLCGVLQQEPCPIFGSNMRMGIRVLTYVIPLAFAFGCKSDTAVERAPLPTSDDMSAPKRAPAPKSAPAPKPVPAPAPGSVPDPIDLK